MPKRDSFLLRLDPKIMAAIRKWSDDEMRSINGQIEYLLRQSLLRSQRLKQDGESQDGNPQSEPGTDQESGHG